MIDSTIGEASVRLPIRRPGRTEGATGGRHHRGMRPNEAYGKCRIDKWLWAARFVKTRSAATDLVLAGHVKVGGERIKPAREVTVGDSIEIRLGAIRRAVVVTGLADRRGPAKVAATLYEETPESREERERVRLEQRLARPLGADLGARPTKQERRRLDALRRGQRRR